MVRLCDIEECVETGYVMDLKAYSPAAAQPGIAGGAARPCVAAARMLVRRTAQYTVNSETENTYTSVSLSSRQCLHQFYTSVIICVICAIKKFSNSSQFDSVDKRYTFISMI